MDINYLLLLQDMREALNGALDGVFLMMTKLGETTTFILVTALIYWCYKKRLGIYMMFSFGLSIAINFILKFTFCVDRPWIRDCRIKPVEKALPMATGYSFPSGHTANATSFFGSLAVHFKKSKLVQVLCIILIILVGFSRNYLGVHTPQDVLVSIVAGCIVLYAVKKLLDYIEENPKKDIIVLLVGLVISLGFLICANLMRATDLNNSDMRLFFSQIAGTMSAVVIGWVLERRYLNFKNEAKILVQVIKYIVGITVFIGLNQLIGIVICDPLGMVWGTFVNSFICFFYVVYLYPLIFTKVLQMKVFNKKQVDKEKM